MSQARGNSMEMAMRKNTLVETNRPSQDNDVLSPDGVRIFTASDLSNMTVHQAAREGEVVVMEKLMEKYQNSSAQKKKRLNLKDDNKLTPLHYAARYNHYHMLSYLIKNGASVLAKGEDNATALHFLAKYKKKVLQHEASTEEDSDDEDELPPEENLSCLQLLVDAGAHLNARDTMGLTPLHHACTRGNTAAIREMLRCSGIGLEMVDHQGMTGLHLACLYGHLKIVKLLIDAGSNLRCRDKDMTTPLHLACAEGSIEITQLLLERADAIQTHPSIRGNGETKEKESKNIVIESPIKEAEAPITFGGAVELLQDTDGEKNLPLHLAIENGHLDLVQFLVDKAKACGLGSMIEYKRARDDSCLHLAVASNSLAIVEFLLDQGADINARNYSLSTPLFLAAQHNSHVILKFLLEKNANIEMKDSDFMSPLLVTAKYGHFESLNHLLMHNADVTETDKDDRTCIMWCAEEDRTDALKLLLKGPRAKALIEERDRYNNTALHMASTKGHVNIVKILLEYKASADTKNDDDRNTLHMAALHGNDRIIPDLISRDRGIINATDEESNTALHLAAMGGNLKCVSILIQLGANIELRNAQQWTPLDVAAAFGFEKPARVLLEAGAAIQPRGKIKVSGLHLAAQFGHVEIINLLLQWKADVTFRSAEGKNALDFAIDHNQKDCVLVLIRHETWKSSLRNSVINPVNGRMLTPMRKMIQKMPDMAEIVYNQCIVDNGKKPEDDEYKITLDYEFLDDMYASTTWMDWTSLEELRKQKIVQADTTNEDYTYTVYDDNDHLTKEAMTYTQESDELQLNHPLKIMVTSKREELLVHPVVTGLLTYKWRRYVYYVSLLLFCAYLALLNAYMLSMPRTYQVDWQSMYEVRLLAANESTLYDNSSECGGQTQLEYINAQLNAAGIDTSNGDETQLSCYYYRTEIDIQGCLTVSSSYTGLRIAIFVFSIFNLIRELVNQRLAYIDFTNAVEVSLYVLSLLVCINYTPYYVETLVLTTQNTGDNSVNGVDQCTGFNQSYFDNLQDQTELRQEWQMEVGAFAVFLSWMVLLLFIQKIPHLGIFVVMFTDILKTFAQFFIVFVFFILGFALSFYILLGNQYVFDTWYNSIVKTTVMMIGELEYSGIFFASQDDPTDYYNQVFTYQVSLVLFVVFLLVMTIIIMNLLVGLAVGDIIEVQEHATLERLGMQVDLALDVEFTIPAFFRKKVCLRKQTIEVNKYRRSNMLVKFLYEDSELTAESLQKTFDKEIGESDEMKGLLDRVALGMTGMRTKMSDVINEQADVKLGISGVRSLVRDSQRQNEQHAQQLRSILERTKEHLAEKISTTQEGLTEITESESNQTRGKVESTSTMVQNLKSDLTQTDLRIYKIKEDLSTRMDTMQAELMARNWDDLERGVKECNTKIENTQTQIMSQLEEMKLMLIREKLMTAV